jgi:predicted nucleic acid-binding protein
VSARLAYVEVLAALAAARRARRLSERGLERAIRVFDARWEELSPVEVDERLVLAASAVAESFELRALGAIHLAAALSVANEELLVATWDAELSRAAQAAGLPVAP